MGKEKYITDIRELFKKSPVVDTRSVDRIIRSRSHTGGQYGKQLIRNMVAGGEIKRLARGYYTMHDDPSLAVLCFAPAYLGLQDALSFHNLWEQETIPVIVTSHKMRQGLRNILGTNVLVCRLDRKYMFGYEYSCKGDLCLPYSDIEKTLIDIAYFNEKIDNEVLLAARRKIDSEKLKSYLKRYPPKIAAKVEKMLYGYRRAAR